MTKDSQVITLCEEVYAIAAAALKRCRWLSIITLGLAFTLMIQYFISSDTAIEEDLEWYASTSEQRLQEIQLLDRRLSRDGLDERERVDIAIKLAKLKQAADKAEAALRGRIPEQKHDSGSVPFLGISMSIPLNLYIPVVLLIMLIFSVGIWLTLRSVQAAISQLDYMDRLKVYANPLLLHFPFSPHLGLPSMPVGYDGSTTHPSEDKAAMIINRLTLVLPSFIVLGFCTLSMEGELKNFYSRSNPLTVPPSSASQEFGKLSLIVAMVSIIQVLAATNLFRVTRLSKFLLDVLIDKYQVKIEDTQTAPLIEQRAGNAAEDDGAGQGETMVTESSSSNNGGRKPRKGSDGSESEARAAEPPDAGDAIEVSTDCSARAPGEVGDRQEVVDGRP